MKKSRTGVALLFLFFLVVGFGVLVFIFSELSDGGEAGSGLADFFGFGNKVGVIEIEGTISSSDTILKQLEKFGKRSSVKAILLRINSPGGAVAPAQEIYRQIGKVRKKKPVVASMETVGASAAYYIASNTDRIVCSRGTITGSIGVIMILAEVHKIIEKLGVDVNVIKAGKYKDIGSAVRPLTEDERKLLESFAKEIHEQFIHDVATGRKGKIELEKLRTIADGSFFSGERAHKLGLVDTLGNFYDAVKIAGKLGGIEGEPELVYPKKKWGGYLNLLLGSVTGLVTRAADASRLIQNVPLVR
ncbi:MAG: signal peptide peptidase SppA [Deltaproteobacteria bacterium]